MLNIHWLSVGALLLAFPFLCRAQLPDAIRSAVRVNHAYDVNSNVPCKLANGVERKLDHYHYHSREAKQPVPMVRMIQGGGYIAFAHCGGSTVWVFSTTLPGGFTAEQPLEYQQIRA
jgi:hypothetical protein